MATFARGALAGVGDRSLGEWTEWTGTYYHLKRRLSVKEQKQVGEAIDIRGTDEQERRYAAVKCYLPAGMKGYKE